MAFELYGADECTVEARKDPHLHFAHGGRADFRGEHNAVFNFLSARNVSLNVRTTQADFHWAKRLVHGTKLEMVYLNVRTLLGHTVLVSFNSSSPHQAAIKTSTDARSKWSTQFLLPGEDYSHDNIRAHLSTDKKLVLTVAEKWEMVATRSPFPFGKLNRNQSLLDVSIKALYDADHDVVAPHGIVGQSFDGDDTAIDGARDSRSGDEGTTSAQAEGAIEGSMTDYKIHGNDPFSPSFTFSRFDLTAASPRNTTQLSGTRHAKVATKLMVESMPAAAD